MQEQELCEVCGEVATMYFGKPGVFPLCDSKLCYAEAIEQINKALAIESEKRKKGD